MREVYYYAYSAYRRANYEQCSTTETSEDYYALNGYRDTPPFSDAIVNAYSAQTNR